MADVEIVLHHNGRSDIAHTVESTVAANVSFFEKLNGKKKTVEKRIQNNIFISLDQNEKVENNGINGTHDSSNNLVIQNGTDHSTTNNISSIFLSKSNSDLASPAPSPYLQSKGSLHGTTNDIVAKAISKLEADIKAKSKKKFVSGQEDMSDSRYTPRTFTPTVVNGHHNGSHNGNEGPQNGCLINEADNIEKQRSSSPTRLKKTKALPLGKSKAKPNNVTNGISKNKTVPSPKTKPKPTPNSITNTIDVKPVLSKPPIPKQKQDTASKILKRTAPNNKPTAEKAKDIQNKTITSKFKPTPKLNNKSSSASSSTKSVQEKKTPVTNYNTSKNRTDDSTTVNEVKKALKSTEKVDATKTSKAPVGNGLAKKNSNATGLKQKGLVTAKTNGVKASVKTIGNTNKPKPISNVVKAEKPKVTPPKPEREKSSLSIERKKQDVDNKTECEISDQVKTEKEATKESNDCNNNKLVETTVVVKNLVKKLESGGLPENTNERIKDKDYLIGRQNGFHDREDTKGDSVNIDIDVDSSVNDIIKSTENGVQSYVDRIKNEINKKNFENTDANANHKSSADQTETDDSKPKQNPYTRNVPSKEFLEFLEDYKINEGNTNGIVERNEVVYETGKYASPSLIRPVLPSNKGESINPTYTHKIKIADLKKKKLRDDADNKVTPDEQTKDDYEDGIEPNGDSNIADTIIDSKRGETKKTDFSSWYDKTYGHYAS